MVLVKIVAVATTLLSVLNYFIQGDENDEELVDGSDYFEWFAKVIVFLIILGYTATGVYILWILVSEKNYLAIGAAFTCIYEIDSYSKIPGALKDGGFRAKVRFKKRTLNIVATLPLLIFAFSN